jgi:hypothetical protein
MLRVSAPRAVNVASKTPEVAKKFPQRGMIHS